MARLKISWQLWYLKIPLFETRPAAQTACIFNDRRVSQGPRCGQNLYSEKIFWSNLVLRKILKDFIDENRCLEKSKTRVKNSGFQWTYRQSPIYGLTGLAVIEESDAKLPT